MTTFPSLVEFSDVKDSPRVRMTLPGPLSLGTRLLLRTVVRRKNGTRSEELRLEGEFKVVSSSFDVTGASRQVVSVEAVRVAPSWKAVKNAPASQRKLPPARAPRTVVA